MSFRSFGGYSSSSEVALTLEALARPPYRLSPTFERFLWWPRERHVLLGSLWSTQLLIVPMPAYLQATTVECLTAYPSRVLEHVSRPNPVTLFFSILKPISNSDLLNRQGRSICIMARQDLSTGTIRVVHRFNSYRRWIMSQILVKWRLGGGRTKGRTRYRRVVVGSQRPAHQDSEHWTSHRIINQW